MEIKYIKIEGIGGIRFAELQFNSNVNIICGPNSIGKTTIIECVSHMGCWGQTSILKKNALSEKGAVEIYATKLPKEIHGASEKLFNYKIDYFRPSQQDNLNNAHAFLDPYFISIKAKRLISYKQLLSIGQDKEKKDWEIGRDIESGVVLDDLKNWFVNRYLFADKEGALRESQLKNFELAKECFSIINPEFKFKTVLAESFDIILETPTGDIYYEYLSSGYKSILYILFAIIKEIELRFKEPSIYARDFDGIVLIDEIELHLHPEWQSKIISVLTKTFPKVQFFITTHSPHVIQTAAPSQVIALEEVEPGRLRKKDIPKPEYGFQGWTIEEILTDVMGMSDLRSSRYKELTRQFYAAVDRDDKVRAEKLYSMLCSILHPRNVMRKILKIQMGGIIDNEEFEKTHWDSRLMIPKN